MDAPEASTDQDGPINMLTSVGSLRMKALKMGQIDRREAVCTFSTLVGESSANFPVEVFRAHATGKRKETQDTLEGLCVSAGLGAPQDSQEVLVEAAGRGKSVPLCSGYDPYDSTLDGPSPSTPVMGSISSVGFVS